MTDLILVALVAGGMVTGAVVGFILGYWTALVAALGTVMERS